MVKMWCWWYDVSVKENTWHSQVVFVSASESAMMANNGKEDNNKLNKVNLTRI